MHAAAGFPATGGGAVLHEDKTRRGAIVAGRDALWAGRTLGLLLAAALTLVAVLPASGQSRADSAAVLLETAETMENAGNEASARALLQYLATRFPDTESGRIAASRLEMTRRLGPRRGGETELKVWGASFGIWLGLATPLANEADDPGSYGAGLLLGGPGGFLLAKSLTDSRSVSMGQARAITWGGTWGTLQGLTLALATESDNPFVGMVLGGLAGTAVGIAASQREISPGTATSATLGSLWGTWFAIATSAMAGFDVQEGSATAIFMGNAGLAIGAAVGAEVPLSRPRARMISVGGLLGTAGGFGIVLIAQPEDWEVAWGLVLGGGVAGLAIGASLTREMDVGEVASQPQSGGALLNRHGGEWFVATPLPSPAVGMAAHGPRAGERTTAWRVPLLSARF